MVNNFTRLSLQGKSLGDLYYNRTKNVGDKGSTKVAELSINRTLSKVLINPQPDFNFGRAFEENMKLINGHVTAGTARNNSSGVRVATIGGMLLPISDNKQDDVAGSEFDSFFVSGKDKHAVAKVRSADAFDKEKLVLVSTTENIATERGQAVLDDNGDTIINNYSLSFIEEGKPLDEDNEIRIMLSPADYEQAKPFLKYGAKLVPENLKFAFVGNDITDWAIYAERVIPREEGKLNKGKQEAKSTQEKANK
ncbi:hypothetical protein [Fructobacillus fructosus]|uniref:hypothetical protein n=1 Tax=Fructobacillus fructosus TaxID=1631 RepID=UPI002DAE407A|nr:hypothetical protein LMG30235_GOPAMIKF_01335 [Fructobacillus fructosus]CAK1251493.1 hypothetical protein LMG30234_GAICNKDF_01425 [Fructobacillus fructosus]CAK1251706.1 hypothetical protein R54866_LGPIEIPA_01434 [Fructobacillus fructosus]